MKKIIIFGTGNAARKVTNYVDKTKNIIIGYADNDEKKHGGKFRGKNVLAPSSIPECNYDYIVIASSYWREILQQLLKMGVKRKSIKLPLAKMSRKTFKREFEDIYNIYGKLVFEYKRWKTAEQFNPDIMGVLVNPYYFSRKKLYQDIQEYKKYIHGKCMDFGCGTKPYRKLFNTSEYIGVEIDTGAREKGITYYDGSTIPFEDETFDSILSSEVFEHVVNIEDILKELHRVLKPQGTMLVTVPFAYPRHCWPYDYKRYTSEGLKELLENAGFECLEYKRSSNYVEALTQLKNVYLAEEVHTKGSALSMAKNVIIAMNNIGGLLGGTILPQSDKLYLDNVIVVKKRG